MLQVGQQVRVLEPFTRDFPDIYTITEVIINPDGQVVYIIKDAGFDSAYLEVV